VKDCAAERVYLIATIFAFITLTAANAVIARLHNATLWAGRHTAVGLLEYIVETGVIVREQFIEAFDGYLFHISSVLQRLHVVKG
jgi:hypothetical protein